MVARSLASLLALVSSVDGTALLFRSLDAISNATERICTQGIMTVTNRSTATLHTYTAPESGWLVTSHMIDLPTQLLVVDAHYALP